MELKKLDINFSVCKLKKLSNINYDDEYWFLTKTDEEVSLVCRSEYVPADNIQCEDGWKAFRIQGVLDFSLIGILAKISTILAENKIGIFVVSTFNTDYILVKDNQFNSALEVLEKAGYIIIR